MLKRTLTAVLGLSVIITTQCFAQSYFDQYRLSDSGPFGNKNSDNNPWETLNRLKKCLPTIDSAYGAHIVPQEFLLTANNGKGLYQTDDILASMREIFARIQGPNLEGSVWWQVYLLGGFNARKPPTLIFRIAKLCEDNAQTNVYTYDPRNSGYWYPDSDVIKLLITLSLNQQQQAEVIELGRLYPDPVGSGKGYCIDNCMFGSGLATWIALRGPAPAAEFVKSRYNLYRQEHFREEARSREMEAFSDRMNNIRRQDLDRRIRDAERALEQSESWGAKHPSATNSGLQMEQRHLIQTLEEQKAQR